MEKCVFMFISICYFTCVVPMDVCVFFEVTVISSCKLLGSTWICVMSIDFIDEF